MTTKQEALNTEGLPAYAAFLREEERLVRAVVAGKEYVLDLGGGDGRAIPFAAPRVKQYVLIDNDMELLKEAEKKRKTYRNVFCLWGDICNPPAYQPAYPNQASIALFNTVGAVDDPIGLLHYMNETSSAVFFTVMGRGEPARTLRTEYYEKHSIPFTRDENDTFFSSVWKQSRGYTLDETIALAESVGIQVEEAGTLSNLGHYLVGKGKN